jgi:predicted permease
MEINIADFYVRIATLLLIVILGFFLGKRKLINSSTNKSLVDLLLYVFMPAAFLIAFPDTYSESNLNLFFSGALAGLVVIITLIVVSKLLFNKYFYKGEIRYHSQFAFIFNNATFLGFPLISAAFGEAGLVPYCGFIMIFNPALFSYGTYLFTHKFSWKDLLKTLINPNILAVILGFLFFFFEIALPSPVESAVGFLASAMTPLSLICVGFMLSATNFKKLFRKWRLALAAFLQLTLAPVLTFYFLTFLNFPESVIIICTILQSLPTATSLALFAKKYEGNHLEASELVAISTVLSIFTLPVIIGLLLQ